MSRLPRRTAKVSFEGTDYDGISVVLNLNIPLGFWVDLTAEGLETDLAAQAEFIVTIVKSWDLEDDEGPIPVTPEGVRRLDDLGFVAALFNAWVAAMQGDTEVSVPLESRSSGGDT